MGYEEEDYDYADGFEEPRKGPSAVLIVLGVALAVFLLGGGVCAALMIPALERAKARANQVKCASSLRQIGFAAVQYADDKRSFPYDASGDVSAVLRTLQQSGYLELPEEFVCPEAQGGASYEGFAVPYSNNTRSTTVIAWDAVPHLDKGREVRNVLMADCTVQRVSEEEFIVLKKKHDAYVAEVLSQQGPK